MQWSQPVRIAIVIAVAAIIIWAIAAQLLSGQPVDAQAILLAIGSFATGVVGGLATAAGPSPQRPARPVPPSVEVGPDDDALPRPGGSAGPLAAVALLLCAGALSSCAGRQCPTPTPEQIEAAARYVVPYLEDAVEDALGEDEEGER